MTRHNYKRESGMRSWAGVYFHFTFLLSTAGKHGVPIIDCPVCLDIFSSLFSTDTTVIYYYYYYYDFSHVSRVPATSDESGFYSIVSRSTIVWRVRFVFFSLRRRISLEDDPEELCHFLLFSSPFPRRRRID